MKNRANHSADSYWKGIPEMMLFSENTEIMNRFQTIRSKAHKGERYKNLKWQASWDIKKNMTKSLSWKNSQTTDLQFWSNLFFSSEFNDF